MTWRDLVDLLRRHALLGADAPPAPTGAITAVSYDSRVVRPGAVFVALRGRQADGTAFAREAMARGAAGVVSEAPPPQGPEGAGAPWFTVTDARAALAQLAAAFHDHPSDAMRVVGITGTNGKTTTAYLAASIFEAAGVACGIVGTVGYRVGGATRPAIHTTPEAPELQAMLREMVDAGCGACAMEVSSHALALRRADAITFAAGVFTNLTRDHLDFHGDMERYFQAKARLFDLLPREAPGLVNVDDPRGAALAQTAARPVTFAVNRAADITPGPVSMGPGGVEFDVRTPRGALHVRSSLVGRPNVYNILAAVGTACALDVPFDAIERGVRALAGVPGRFEVVSSPADPVTVVVDYAHTDDALKNALETARPLTSGRLITVFGCGGDRDRTKRPLMGVVAARLSDVVVITSDNPRSEDPGRIIEDVRGGLVDAERRAGAADRVLSLVDRAEAIEAAIARARPGDLVLIAGKGHEKVQIIGDRALPFDDAEVARGVLARRRSKKGVRT